MSGINTSLVHQSLCGPKPVEVFGTLSCEDRNTYIHVNVLERESLYCHCALNCTTKVSLP